MLVSCCLFRGKLKPNTPQDNTEARPALAPEARPDETPMQTLLRTDKELSRLSDDAKRCVYAAPSSSKLDGGVVLAHGGQL